MNREIKFRIWMGDRFKTIPDEQIGKRCFHSPCMYSQAAGGYVVVGFEQREDRVFQQFTSLKDKNGKEIFEGDIVKWTVRPLWMRYPEEVEQWEREGSKMHDYFAEVRYCGAVIEPFSHNPFVPYFHGDCEVAGNIFENPELLK